jgi:hypothetical protein
LLVHPTQTPAAVSQTGLEPLQRVAFVAEQAPHAPLGSQAGMAPPHCALVAQPTQTWVPRLHTGVRPPQSALDPHPTQRPAATLQIGVALPQCVALVAEH